jgi:pimeloyl-ACP methyl ester carboxylesterase
MLAGLSADPSEQGLSGLAAPSGAGFVDRLPEPKALPGWLTQEELDHYVEEFRRTGFTGGINWYRNFDRNWELTEHLASAHVTAPSLFITGSNDPVNLMSSAVLMDGWLDDHRGTHYVEGAGHWVQQEKAAEVNALLISFLDGLSLGG